MFPIQGFSVLQLKTGIMKTNEKCILKRFPLIFFFLIAVSNLYAQSYTVTVKNETYPDSKHLQFDIYVKANEKPIFYGLGQFKVLLSPALINGGTLTASIVPFLSDLTNPAQIPGTVRLQPGSVNIFMIIPQAISAIPKKQSDCSLISEQGEGTRVCRVLIANSNEYKKVPSGITFLYTSPNATNVFTMSSENLLVPGK
jgi:hypothetical protein